MSAPFAQLERDLVAAAARLAPGEAAPPAAVPPASPHGARRRLRTPATALAVVLLAVAAAGAWLAAGREARRPGSQRAAPAWRLDVGESRIASARAPAAHGQPEWAVRVSRPTPTSVCVAVGQISARKLGIVGSDGRFRRLPTGRANACGAETALAARVVRDGGTVVGGFAGDGLRSVRIEDGGAPALVPHSPEGAFVYVTRSTRVPPIVSLRFNDGRAEQFIVPRTARATRAPSAPIPLSPAPALPTPRPVEPSHSPRGRS